MSKERIYPKGDTPRTCVRDGFNRQGGVICKDCFDKKLEIDRLRAEIISLKQKLNYREKSLKNGVFGGSTPSSRIPIKENATEEKKLRKGGAKPGHKGHGRKRIDEQAADKIVQLEMPQSCSDCGFSLIMRDNKTRVILDVHSTKAKSILYKMKSGECPGCSKIHAKKPDALPKSLYSNRLVAQAATMHYLHGFSLGKIVEVLGDKVNRSGLINAFHRLSNMCNNAQNQLIQDFRNAPVKHADETGWRNDGDSGYAWLFCSSQTSLFQFQKSRSGQIVRSVFGDQILPGVLVVDRYGAYNKAPCSIQYCFAHLLRDTTKLEDEFGDEQEVLQFVASFAPLLSEAMRLRNQQITDEEYYQRAATIEKNIKRIVSIPAKHLGIIAIQNIFTKNENRLYLWVKNREVPAENNFAERELRPTVIARKTSFGSQSEKGALTRGKLMSVLHSVKKRLKNKSPEDWLCETLNTFIEKPPCEHQIALPEVNFSTHFH